MITQKYSSRNTSVNKNHLPKAFTKISSWKQDSINLDLGGGKYDNATKYLRTFDCTNLVLDPFNRTEQHNTTVLKLIKNNGGCDTVTCLNVLNVIAEQEIRLQTIKQAYTLLKDNGVAYFQIYEGNKSRIGCETKKDCWQNNLLCADYIFEIENYFKIKKITDKIIICTK